MTLQIGLRRTLSLLLAVSLLLGPGVAMGQTQPRPESTPAKRPPAGPNQPVVPQYPRLQRLPAPEQPLRAPFRLTPQHEAYLDRVLQVWEESSQRIETFECKFTRWEYDPVFGPPNAPRYVDGGKLKYAAPDRGMFHVTHTEKNEKMVAIEPDRAEHWICDGNSIYEYNHVKRQLVEHKLPPGLQGKAIADGPLPFLFGAEAQKLKQRYFIRIIQAPAGRTGETWLEAFPRFQRDAANFQRAELILANKDVMPLGLHIYLPNGKNHTAYQFHDVVTNDLLRFFKGDPFRASTPFGWKKIVEEAPTRQVSRVPAMSRKQ